ncbi:unnamed protein product [Cuscuta europaea]|uniref:Uncharacterized protein n=1 Tax=Cuscuta europaea TaxID=41803 RepID=A0A9P0ZNF6_CUSEU|nr:unnamed protein product [Cuscuta europaea]
MELAKIFETIKKGKLIKFYSPKGMLHILSCHLCNTHIHRELRKIRDLRWGLHRQSPAQMTGVSACVHHAIDEGFAIDDLQVKKKCMPSNLSWCHNAKLHNRV